LPFGSEAGDEEIWRIRIAKIVTIVRSRNIPMKMRGGIANLVVAEIDENVALGHGEDLHSLPQVVVFQS